jgi:hypothetical protein
VSHERSPEVLQPGRGALDDPALGIAQGIAAGQSLLGGSSCGADRRHGVADAPERELRTGRWMLSSCRIARS